MGRFTIASLFLTPLACFAEPTDVVGASSEGTTGTTIGEEADVSTALGSTGGGSTTEDADSGSTEPLGSSSTWFDTTGVDFSSSGLLTGSSGFFAECGNGIVEGEESCDEEVVSLRPGACRPDCSGPIPTRRIVISASASQGDLGADPIGTVDSMCSRGSKALFAVGEQRRATVAANVSVDPIDWVLEPFTAYVNAADELVWITDEVPLLGVRAGVPASLIHPIVPFRGDPPGVLTGMRDDWTSPPQADCSGWTSASSGADHSSGIPWIVDRGGFLDNGALASCDLFDRVYCVEQAED